MENKQLVKKYALSLYQIGQKENALNEIQKGVRVVDSLYKDSSTFRYYLLTKKIADSDKKKILSKYLDKKIVIKWPNDLLVENKKICGILQETFFNNKNKFMVVGIGVNILDSPKISKYETTYNNKYSKKKVDKMLVFRSIKLMFEKNLNKFKN